MPSEVGKQLTMEAIPLPIRVPPTTVEVAAAVTRGPHPNATVVAPEAPV